MKKLVLTSVLSLAVAGAAFAQGSVNWSTPFASITAQTNATVASTFGASAAPTGTTVGATGGAQSGALFYYALLYTSYSGSQLAVPTTMAQLDSQGWLATGLMATNSNSAGRLSTVAGSTQVTVPWASGTTQSIVLAGWSANLGSTWGSVSNVLSNWNSLSGGIVGNAFFGLSATGYIAANAANPGTTVFNNAATPQGLPIFSLNTQLNEVVAVPEPGTLALAALGGASLLMFRRKK